MSDSNGVIDLDALVKPNKHYRYKGEDYFLTSPKEGKVIGLRQMFSKESDRAQETPIIVISMCLKDNKGAYVSEEVLKEWDAPVIDRLFDDAKERTGIFPKPKTKKDWQEKVDEANKAIEAIDALEEAGVPN